MLLSLTGCTGRYSYQAEESNEDTSFVSVEYGHISSSYKPYRYV